MVSKNRRAFSNEMLMIILWREYISCQNISIADFDQINREKNKTSRNYDLLGIPCMFEYLARDGTALCLLVLP